MPEVFAALKRLTGWQRLLIGLLVFIIVATWIAVCVILASYLGP